MLHIGKIGELKLHMNSIPNVSYIH